MHSKSNRKPPQWFVPIFGGISYCKSYYVASSVYIIQYGGHDRNIDMNKILSLLAKFYVERCMDDPLKFHMRESYAIKYHCWYPDNPNYMEELFGEHVD